MSCGLIVVPRQFTQKRFLKTDSRINCIPVCNCILCVVLLITQVTTLVYHYTFLSIMTAVI